MKSSKTSFALDGNVVLISIHPSHVNNIVSGDKNLEFRRVWPSRAVDTLVVYATYPEQRLAAVVQVSSVLRASKTTLWRAAVSEGGGLTRKALFDYLDGKALGVAISLGRRVNLGPGLDAKKVFGTSFRAPQSYRYLTEAEKVKVRALLGVRQ